MGFFWEWAGQNWFNLFSLIGIVGSLVYTGVSYQTDAKSRRVSNLLTITSNHREIWRDFSRNPAFKRVLDPLADIQQTPITAEEEVLVNMVISHIYSVFYAGQNGLLVALEGLNSDIAGFFALPIPNSVWKNVKNAQNRVFADYVESCCTQTDVA